MGQDGSAASLPLYCCLTQGICLRGIIQVLMLQHLHILAWQGMPLTPACSAGPFPGFDPFLNTLVEWASGSDDVAYAQVGV